MANDEESTKNKTATTQQQTEATKQLTEAEKKREEQLRKVLEIQEQQAELEKQRMDRLRLLTALEGDAAANAGNLRDAYEKLQQATEGYKEASEALSHEQGILADMYQELESATGDRKKQLEEDIKLAEQQVKNREQEIKDFEEITKQLRDQTKEYRLLSDVQKKQQPMLESFFSTLTGGALQAGMAQQNFAFKLGDGIKQMANSANAGLQMKLAFQQVVNIQNIAAFALNTVVKSTIAMATAFDQAQAKLAATTGAAQKYNNVLLDVQKQGNRFGISVSEGGEAMASLIEGFGQFHKSAPGVQRDLAIGVAGLNKLGVSSSESASLLNNLNKIMGQSGKQALETTKKIGMMGTAIGISTSKMLKDYNASLKTLAVYGDKSIKVFTGIAAAAKAAGVETGTLLGLADKFDTFSGAAETTGKLNAILGSQLSATEMLTMSEDERIKTLISSVQATGQAFGSMDKFTQKAIANAAGITDMAEANRIFGMSISEYENYEDQMKSSSESQKKFDDALKAATPVFEKLKLIALELAANFGPVLEKIGGVVQWLLDSFAYVNDAMGGWLGTIVGGIAGLTLFASALGGIVNIFKFLKTAVWDNIISGGKWILTKLGIIQATNAETAAELANSAAKETNTLVTGSQAAVEQADVVVKGENTLATGAETLAEEANTVATGANNATKNIGIMTRLRVIGSKALEAAQTAALTAYQWASVAVRKVINFLMNSEILKTTALAAKTLILNGYQVVATGIRWALGTATAYVATTSAASVAPTLAAGTATATAGAAMAGAIPIILAFGAAILLIGAGIYLAATGLGNLVASFALLNPTQIAAASVALVLFGVGLAALLVSLAWLAFTGVGPLAAGLLMSIGVAILFIGMGIGLAAEGMGTFVGSITEEAGTAISAFAESMGQLGVALVSVGTGLLLVLVPMLAFIGAISLVAMSPFSWLAVALLTSIGAAIFMMGLGAKLAADSMTNLINTIEESKGLGDVISGLFGTGDLTMSEGIIQRVMVVRQLISDVESADIKSELENIALITTGISAGLMTQNTVSNLVVVSALADTIKNIFNPEITIEMDSGAVEKLFKEGVYKVNRST